jgi:glutathione peroxidase
MISRMMLAFTSLLITTCGAGSDSSERTGSLMTKTTTDVLSVPFETITGERTSLNDFAGKAVLIVNVASECGFTPQYAGLQALYEEWSDSGFVVLGFPANDFGAQEPGSNEEILEYCTSRFNVTFPMMAKVSVKGPDKHPLFTYLTEQSPLAGEIKWNFTKFLLDKEGRVVARFDTSVEPRSPEVRDAIRKALWHGPEI